MTVLGAVFLDAFFLVAGFLAAARLVADTDFGVELVDFDPGGFFDGAFFVVRPLALAFFEIRVAAEVPDVFDAARVAFFLGVLRAVREVGGMDGDFVDFLRVFLDIRLPFVAFSRVFRDSSKLRSEPQTMFFGWAIPANRGV